MRPNATYTKEEYDTLKKEIVNLKRELAVKDKEIYDLKFVNDILNKVDNGLGYDKVRSLIAFELGNRNIYEKYRYNGIKKKLIMAS